MISDWRTFCASSARLKNQATRRLFVNSGGRLPKRQGSEMRNRDERDKIDWDNLERVWKAAGLSPDALPKTRVERAEHWAEPPEPDTPELEAPPLSDDEWEILAPLMPAKNKYLSRLQPRDFIVASLFWVWCDQKFVLVPVPSVEQFRAKL
jgi:hypothetical protein